MPSETVTNIHCLTVSTLAIIPVPWFRVPHVRYRFVIDSHTPRVSFPLARIELSAVRDLVERAKYRYRRHTSIRDELRRWQLRLRRLVRRSDAVACMCAATLEGPRTPGRPPTGHGERGRVHGPWNAKWGSCTKKKRDGATLTSARKAECTTKRLDWNEKQRTDAWTLMLVGKQAASVGNGAPIAKKRGSRTAPPGKERRVLWSRARTRLFTSRVPATTYCCNETTIKEREGKSICICERSNQSRHTSLPCRYINGND